MHERFTGAQGPATAVAAAEPIRVDSQLAAHTAGRVLDVSLRLGQRTRVLVPTLTAGPLAYGGAAAALGEAQSHLATELESVLERVTAALQADVDKLYALAFAFKAAEDAAADAVGGFGGT